MQQYESMFNTIAANIRRIEQSIRDLKANTQGGGYWISMGPYLNLSPFSVGTEQPFLLTIPRDMRLLKIAFTAYVFTTTNSSNYWTIDVSTESNIVAMKDTKLFAADSWTPVNITTSSTPAIVTAELAQATDKYIYLSVAKTGSPGNLLLATPTLFFV